MELKTSSDRSFGLVFAAVFAIIGLWPLLHEASLRWWGLAVAAGFLAVALIRPNLLRHLNRIWTQFGLLLHKIVTPVVMSLLFFVTVTPIGLIMRLFGKRPLQLGFEPQIESYWIVLDPPGPAPESMKMPF